MLKWAHKWLPWLSWPHVQYAKKAAYITKKVITAVVVHPTRKLMAGVTNESDNYLASKKNTNNTWLLISLRAEKYNTYSWWNYVSIKYKISFLTRKIKQARLHSAESCKWSNKKRETLSACATADDYDRWCTISWWHSSQPFLLTTLNPSVSTNGRHVWWLVLFII